MKEQWPAQKVYQRISLVKRDVASLNRDLNAIDGEINYLRHRKKTLRAKISKKGLYLNQLNIQLHEAKQREQSVLHLGLASGTR